MNFPTDSKSQRILMATAATLGALILGGCTTANKPFAEGLTGSGSAEPAYEDRLSRGVYAVAGIGPSRLEPDTSDADGWEPNDRVEPAGQITVGADLTKHLSVEAHSADLGSAGLSPRGRINYHINGASALVYAGGNRHRYRRQGLTGYGRIGVGKLDNTPVGDVPYEQVNATHVLVGAGLEYMTPVGVGVGAEGVVFDKDVQYAQLGLMYRTGRKKQTERPQLAVVEPPVAEEPVIAAATPIEIVDECSSLGGLFEGVEFATDSAGLSSQSVRVLNQVAATLRECPELTLELSAHTDERGSLDYNQVLAGKRAQSVLEYLRATGVSSDRFFVNTVGEVAPIDSNATPEGRARNRRVDFVAR